MLTGLALYGHRYQEIIINITTITLIKYSNIVEVKKLSVMTFHLIYFPLPYILYSLNETITKPRIKIGTITIKA